MMARSRASAKKAGTTLSQRLWGRARPAAGGCVEFTGYINSTGYGQILGDAGRLIGTHRAAWILTHGPIPSGLFVCHACDNRACINPTHLFLGTHQQNVDDMVAKSRQARGSALPHSRLTEADVREIRQTYRVYTIPGRRGRHSNAQELAKRYGVTAKYIKSIARREERADVA